MARAVGRSAARDKAWRTVVTETVNATASKYGAWPARLLDSIWFIDTLDDLTDVDPEGPALAAAVEAKIAAAAAASPLHFRRCTCLSTEGRPHGREATEDAAGAESL